MRGGKTNDYLTMAEFSGARTDISKLATEILDLHSAILSERLIFRLHRLRDGIFEASFVVIPVLISVIEELNATGAQCSVCEKPSSVWVPRCQIHR